MLTRAIMIGIIILSLAYVDEGWCRTAAMKMPCSNCHTMHNSQNNAAVVGLTIIEGSGAAQPALLNNTCYGCHTGTNAAGTMPYVFNEASAVYGATGTEGAPRNTLAGGNFFWVTTDERTGHNVEVISPDFGARTAQGSGGSKIFGGASPDLTCAGTNGCHGDVGIVDPITSMARAHHSNVTLASSTVDRTTTIGLSYRFLQGIDGLEDPDWEFTVSSAADNHNQYKGIDRSNDSASAASSISSLCGGCHGDFHTSLATGNYPNAPSITSNWLRHPVDYDMNNDVGGTEYDGYGAGIGTYMVETPLASASLSGILNNVFGAGNAIITCLTCHRAHGSPYQALLRWDYKNWPGSGYNGCGDCHTFKD